MRACSVSVRSVSALILALGMANASCSADNPESNPSGDSDAGVGGSAVVGGAGRVGGVGGAGGEIGGSAGGSVDGAAGGAAGGSAGGSAGGAGGSGGATGGSGGYEAGGSAGATGGTGGAAGAPGGATGGIGSSHGKPDTCDNEGYTAIDARAELMTESGGEKVRVFSGSTGETGSFELLRAEIYESFGAPTTPGTYTLNAAETNYETCGVCLIHRTGCTKANGQTTCEKVLMPFEGSTYTIHSLGNAVGDTLHITLDDVAFREVTIADDYATTPVANGSTWCMNGAHATAAIVAPGYVDMDQPTGMSCEYPEAPYHFMGPEDGQTTPEPGTVPPMAWPGAYFGGREVGLDLARYRCEHPDVKTLIVIVGAGWCPSCASFMKQSVCPDGGLEDQLHEANAELLYVWGDGNQPGRAASNSYASAKVDSYGCDGGYRVADVDNTAGSRVVFTSQMFEAVPWAAAIRMSDMKMTHGQPEKATTWMDVVAIAEANKQ